MTSHNRSLWIAVAAVSAAILLSVVGIVSMTTSPNTSQPQSVASLSSVPKIVVGNATSYFANDSFRGGGSSWILYQVIPVTVYAPTATALTMSVANLPPQTWVHFGTETLVASPSGTLTTMTVMGMVDNTGLSNHVPSVPGYKGVLPAVAPGASAPRYHLTLEASSSSLTVNSNISLSSISSLGSSLVVLNGSGSQPLFPSNLGSFGSNESETDPINMVYAPSNPSTSPSSLDVSLKVLGVVVNGSLESMPSSLTFAFSQTDFTLTQYQPTFVSVHESNTVPLQTYSASQRFVVAVAETVNGAQFVQNLILTLEPPVNLCPGCK
jgi:hypothetical protein